MDDKIRVQARGTCPACGSPDIDVPEDYSDETIVRCRKCGQHAPWAEFFSEPSDPLEGAS